jgi:hypothetical protein
MTPNMATGSATERALGRYGPGFAALIVLTCLGCMVALWGHYVLAGGFMDTDNYTRMAKLQEVWRHGGWFDPVQYRVGPPEGHSSHWSKPFDIILVAGAIPLAAIFGFVKALFLWGVVVSPITYVGMVYFARWMSQPLIGMRRDWLAAALLATQWSILGGLALGRPDHNVVMLPCFMAMLGFTLRILLLGPNRASAFALGAAASLGVWTSIEFVIAVALTMTAFGLAWLVRRPRMAEMGLHTTAAATFCIAIAIALEKGPDRLAEFTSDQISGFPGQRPYLTGAWAILWLTERSDRPRHVIARGGAASRSPSPACRLIIAPFVRRAAIMVDLYRVTRSRSPTSTCHQHAALRLANAGRATCAALSRLHCGLDNLLLGQRSARGAMGLHLHPYRGCRVLRPKRPGVALGRLYRDHRGAGVHALRQVGPDLDRDEHFGTHGHGAARGFHGAAAVREPFDRQQPDRQRQRRLRWHDLSDLQLLGCAGHAE